MIDDAGKVDSKDRIEGGGPEKIYSLTQPSLRRRDFYIYLLSQRVEGQPWRLQSTHYD